MFTDNRTLSIGISKIDQEHQVLDNLVAKLERMIISQSSKIDLQTAFKDINQAMLCHFKTEEDIFGPQISEYEKNHKAEHTRFLSDIKSLNARLDIDCETWRNSFLDLANELTRHIIKFDMEIKNK